MPSERPFWFKCIAIWLAITIAAGIELYHTRRWFMSLPSMILMLRAGWKWLSTFEDGEVW
jgi:hypothetical protein